LKILLQNKYFPDGKQFKVFLILILNTLKELTIPSLIFSLVNFCSATMASKKDRGKGKVVNPSINKPLAIKPESSPIGTPAALPVTISVALTNWFMTFSPEPNITYSSALAFEYNPFLGHSYRPRMPFIKAEKPSLKIPASWPLLTFPLVFIGFLNTPSKILPIIPLFWLKQNRPISNRFLTKKLVRLST
jgi:hypothetical protein